MLLETSDSGVQLRSSSPAAQSMVMTTVWSKLHADTWESLKGQWRVISLHLLLLFLLLFLQTQAKGMGVCDCTHNSKEDSPGCFLVRGN